MPKKHAIPKQGQYLDMDEMANALKNKKILDVSIGETQCRHEEIGCNTHDTLTLYLNNGRKVELTLQSSPYVHFRKSHK